jgi:hypothetical protein
MLYQEQFTGPKKETKLFHLSKNNRFGLEYPSLDERWERFTTYTLKVILKAINLKFSPNLKELVLFIESNGFSSLEDLLFIDTGRNRPKELKRIEKGYLLHFLDLMLKDFVNRGDFDNEDHVGSDYYDELNRLNELKVVREKLLNSFELFDLDYFWNKKTKQIERKIDEANTVVINENINKVNTKSNYQACVDEFLKPRTEIDYLKSLQNIYSVLEGVVSFHCEGLRLHEKQKMAKYLTGKEEDYETIQHIFAFINDFIHHPTSKKAKSHIFNKQEYIYWWLEINKLIFILNSKD